MKHLLYTLLFFIYLSFCPQNISATCTSSEVEIKVEITPDDWTSLETHWEITDLDGTILHSSSATETLCLSILTTPCLLFNIYDDFGDGIAAGNYKLFYNNIEIVSGDNFGYFYSFQFGSCPIGASCFFSTTVQAEAPYNNSNDNAWFTFTPEQTGSYYLSSCNETNDCLTSMWVYDYCIGLNWDDNPEGSIYYANTGCSDGKASLNAFLQADTPYYIRLKNTDTDCSNTEKSLLINYLGDLIGCADIAACNYDPMATINDPSTCLYEGTPECPSGSGPDLVVLQNVLYESMYLTTLDNDNACYIEEGCVSGYGLRDIIRFTTHIKNIGNLDYIIGQTPSDPSGANEQWEYDPCHGHWHYEGYAEYLLFDEQGKEVPAGFKNGFCVMDLECSDGGTAQYGCGVQGISAGCGDIYDAGLTCQWIDITDILDGNYTFVVRVNWDNSPDSAGHYELAYTNNWAQVCISINRDEAGTPFITKTQEDCDPFTDCLGEIYGNAQYDCAGNCGGNALAGDLDGDALQHTNDVLAYTTQILSGATSPNNLCDDLNSDTQIDLSDAALLIGCINEDNSNHNHQGGGAHSHCNFPTNTINNPNPSYFSIANINPTEQYLDIAVESPYNYLIGYQLQLSGITIASVENLIASDYNSDLLYNDNGVILSLSLTESLINRYISATPILRIHYTTITADYICMGVTALINHQYENVLGIVETPCLLVSALGEQTSTINSTLLSVQVSPNPIQHTATFRFNNPEQQPYDLYIIDILGKEVYHQAGIQNNYISLNNLDLAAGIYLYQLVGKQSSSGKIIVE